MIATPLNRDKSPHPSPISPKGTIIILFFILHLIKKIIIIRFKFCTESLT